MSDKALREPSRVRERGTIVTQPENGEQRIAAIRQIVERGQYAKVDGCMIDLFSAGAIVAVYNALSEKNQARYAAFFAPQMAKIAFKLVK